MAAMMLNVDFEWVQKFIEAHIKRYVPVENGQEWPDITMQSLLDDLKAEYDSRIHSNEQT